MSQILIVEDDTVSQTVIRLALQRLGGHEVHICEDGDEVLRRAREGETDLIVMDVRLADTRVAEQSMDGVKLAQMIKSDPQTRSIPIVLVTAHAMRGDAERFLKDSKADHYISKPITDLPAFTQIVAKLIQESQSEH